MAETLLGVRPSNTEDLLKEPSLAVDLAEPSAEELAIAGELVRSARARGIAMTGPGGMLKALTKTVIETALDEEMTETPRLRQGSFFPVILEPAGGSTRPCLRW